MKTTIEDEKMKDKISDDDRKAINASATRPSSGWTPTSLPRSRSSMRSRRRWRLSATPSSPSCMGQPEVLLVACLTWEAWEVQEELHLELAKEEQAQPSRRLTKSFLGTIVFSWNSNAFM